MWLGCKCKVCIRGEKGWVRCVWWWRAELRQMKKRQQSRELMDGWGEVLRRWEWDERKRDGSWRMNVCHGMDYAVNTLSEGRGREG